MLEFKVIQFIPHKKLYIAKCHLSHKTGKVHVLDNLEQELEIEDILKL